MDREHRDIKKSDADTSQVVTIKPADKQFSTQPHASLLESGLSAGIALPYRCSNGSCGECRARVISGDVEKTRFHDYVLTNAEKTAGVILLCSHRALSNVDIEVREARNAEDIPLQQLKTRVCHTESIDDTLIVRVKILRGKALWYLAGQYATIHLPGVGPRLLPIASCPCEAGYLEFHIAPDMQEIATAIARLPNRERLVIEGPHGHFTVDDVSLSNCHHVFIAVEHQFAVIKPMIEHIIATEIEPEFTLIRVSSIPYKTNLCRSWADAFDWFTYHSVADVDALSSEFLISETGKPVRVYASVPASAHNALKSWLAQQNVNAVIIDETTSVV